MSNARKLFKLFSNHKKYKNVKTFYVRNQEIGILVMARSQLTVCS